MAALKVMTILGTRPEIIRLSAVIAKLDRHVDHVLVHTGQNYDHQLNEVFFNDLGVRTPDHFMGIDTSTLGTAWAGIFIGTEVLLDQEQPDAVLVLGDTNSALAAVMAKRRHVPVFHMEAGNRSFDDNVPEEVNRRIVDHVADINLVYTERSRAHLLAEGLDHRRIYLTGSPLPEVHGRARDGIAASTVLDELGLEEGGYFLASLHREENVDAPDRLERVIACLNALATTHGLPVIVSTHPRTRDRLEGRPRMASHDLVRWADPFGYHDYNRLQSDARCVVSDSGSVAEEAAILGFPAVTLRDSMERPEALDAATIGMSGLDPATLVAAVDLQVDRHRRGDVGIPPEYTIQDTSGRVVTLITSLARLSNAWAGVRATLPS